MSIGPQLVGVGPANDPVARAGVVVTRGTPGRPGAAARQQETFSLLARVQQAINAFRNPNGGVPPIDTDFLTTDAGTPVQARTYAWQEYFRTDNTRIQTYEDVQEMDETTDEVGAALDTLADSAVNPEDGSQYTFILELREGPFRDAAEAIFDQVTESLDLHKMAFSIAREFLKMGDCFCELVVDEQNRLTRLKMLPAPTIWRNEDAGGNFMPAAPAYDAENRCINAPGECAFDQREQLNGRVLAAFYPWQITHFRWNHRGNDRYGRSMLRTARLVWKKLKAAEEALIIARLQRAWMRFVHYIDTTGLDREAARSELMRYRQELTKRFIVDTQLRESPFEVTSDFYMSSGYIRDLDGHKFLPKQAKIEVLQGDHAVLAQISDIEYFQNKLFASLRVPKAYLGFERDINARATLSTQDIQFARTLRRIQSVLAQGYKEIFDFALMLADIDPTQVDYIVRWPAILVSDEERDAIIGRYRAQTDAVYWQMGSPSTKYLVQQHYGFDDEAWTNDLLDAMADPPPRLKVSPLYMPPTQDTDPTPGATDRRQAYELSLKDIDDVSDIPPDTFDQSHIAVTAAERAAVTQGGKNGTRTTGSGGGTTPPARLAGRERSPAGGRGPTARTRAGREELAALLLDELGYDPDLVHGLGGPASAHGPSVRRIIPGRGGGAFTRDPRAERSALSVRGVHGVAGRLDPAPLPRATSARVQGVAARELESFMVDLVRRRRDTAYVRPE